MKNTIPPIMCKNCKHPKGIMFRVDGSKLEEFLGHHIYQCEKCRRRVKVVPQDHKGETDVRP